MPRESVVEIPVGSGNKYRYAYHDGKTLYMGPVGDAPGLSEAEFMRLMASPEEVAAASLRAMFPGDAELDPAIRRLPREFHDESRDPWYHQGEGILAQWHSHFGGMERGLYDDPISETRIEELRSEAKDGTFIYDDYDIKFTDLRLVLHNTDELLNDLVGSPNRSGGADAVDELFRG